VLCHAQPAVQPTAKRVSIVRIIFYSLTYVEGNGHCLICGTILAFVWRKSGKQREASACIVGILPEIQTRHIAIESPNLSDLFQLIRLFVI
jgi:hypothetical protein